MSHDISVNRIWRKIFSFKFAPEEENSVAKNSVPNRGKFYPRPG